MNRDTLRQFFVIFTIIFALVMAWAANGIPLNGRDTGQISDSFNVLFVPAGYVFSIWSIIYLGLAAFAVYHALPSQRQNPRLRSIGWLVAGTNIANGSWIFFWHYGYYVITLLIMFALLAMLIAIYLRLHNKRALPFNNKEKWLVSIPFSIYLGWVTVATIANITTFLDYLGWTGAPLTPVAWTLILLAAGVAIAAIMAFTQSDIAYLLVLVWAFAGISVRWLDLSPINLAGFIAAGLVLLLLIVSRVRGQGAQVLSAQGSRG